MPIETRHPVYTKHDQRRTRARDANDGEDAVKDAGVAYLPKLQDQTDIDYQAYKLRSVFFNATGRSVDGMVGLINRRPPTVELPDVIQDLEENATEEGQSLEELAKCSTEIMLVGGRLGILVDRPIQDNETPFLVVYAAEEITNWRETEDGDLLMVVLEEGYFEADAEDPYKLTAQIRFRELLMGELVDENDEPTGTTGYIQRVWKKAEGQTSGTYAIVETIVPLQDGQPMDAIPFVFVNPKGVGIAVWDPPILDIANVNLAHYRNSADIEHGRHLTALPTPWVSGVDASETGAELPLGSGTAWRLPEGATTGFLEFTGVGIKTLAEGMEEKERKMAALGARMIEPARSGIEAAETARIHAAGTSATLGDIAGSVGSGLEAALQVAAAWEGADPESVSVQMNKDFVDTKLTPQEITALIEAFLKGAITQETLLHNFKLGEILPEDRTIEEEMELLAAADTGAAGDGGVADIAANQGPDAFDVESDEDGNVVRLVRNR